MKTRAQGPADRYLKLIRQFPLRPIRTDEELDAATEVLDSLTGRLDTLTEDERDYLEVLTDQVERYETSTFSPPAVSDQDILHHLIEAKGVTQAEAATATGIAVSTMSELLAGKRKLNRAHIGKLARYFHVEPSVFAFEG